MNTHTRETYGKKNHFNSNRQNGQAHTFKQIRGSNCVAQVLGTPTLTVCLDVIQLGILLNQLPVVHFWILDTLHAARCTRWHFSFNVNCKCITFVHTKSNVVRMAKAYVNYTIHMSPIGKIIKSNELPHTHTHPFTQLSRCFWWLVVLNSFF